MMVIEYRSDRISLLSLDAHPCFNEPVSRRPPEPLLIDASVAPTRERSSRVRGDDCCVGNVTAETPAGSTDIVRKVLTEAGIVTAAGVQAYYFTPFNPQASRWAPNRVLGKPRWPRLAGTRT